MLRIAHTKARIAVAISLVALLALPGEAKTVDAKAAQTTLTAAVVAPVANAPQTAFGLFLDPHAEPVLHIELPAAIWSF